MFSVSLHEPQNEIRAKSFDDWKFFESYKARTIKKPMEVFINSVFQKHSVQAETIVNSFSVNGMNPQILISYEDFMEQYKLKLLDVSCIVSNKNSKSSSPFEESQELSQAIIDVYDYFLPSGDPERYDLSPIVLNLYVIPLEKYDDCIKYFENSFYINDTIKDYGGISYLLHIYDDNILIKDKSDYSTLSQ